MAADAVGEADEPGPDEAGADATTEWDETVDDLLDDKVDADVDLGVSEPTDEDESAVPFQDRSTASEDVSAVIEDAEAPDEAVAEDGPEEKPGLLGRIAGVFSR